MKKEYIITNDEIQDRGLNLCDYLLEETLIPAYIQIMVRIVLMPRCFHLNDNFKSYKDIEDDLEKNPHKIEMFKDLQFALIWNLTFTGEENPVDLYIDSIIVNELKWGKINGFQKGLHYKNN